jgi:prepilin-type N-terminal cleavage/methylation domain-containing protein
MNFRAQHLCRRSSGFTLVEIAISLAVIGIALVGIIGVLPLGMSVQRDNREQTVINQDATVFIEAIRNGSRGLDDLTNYVYAIVNTAGKNPVGYINPVLANAMNFSEGNFSVSSWYSILTNGANIVGLLSTPEFTDLNFNPTTNLFSGGYSNHVVVYVRSISGPAVEKPPQDNPIIQGDAFGYRILCVNAPVALPSSDPQLAANLHELRLTFLWPQLPNGNLGTGRQTYRALVAGQIVANSVAGNYLYFYQPQSFTNAP